MGNVVLTGTYGAYGSVKSEGSSSPGGSSPGGRSDMATRSNSNLIVLL